MHPLRQPDRSDWTRRALLRRAGWAAGAWGLAALWPASALAQTVWTPCGDGGDVFAQGNPALVRPGPAGAGEERAQAGRPGQER